MLLAKKGQFDVAQEMILIPSAEERPMYQLSLCMAVWPWLSNTCKKTRFKFFHGMFVKDPIAITNICQSVKFIGHDQAHPLAASWKKTQQFWTLFQSN